jgi:hypothetical protein
LQSAFMTKELENRMRSMWLIGRECRVGKQSMWAIHHPAFGGVGFVCILIHFKAALGTKRFIIIRAAFPEVTTPL